MNCPDQVLFREIILYLSAIQQEKGEPEEFLVATKKEVCEFWNAEKEVDMREEIRMVEQY